MSLIASPRHSARDLDAWERSERVDRLTAERLAGKLRAKAAKAADDIRAFLVGASGYAGCSWGKDSTVLAHIIASHEIQVPVVWVRVSDVENPDCPLVRDAFLAQYPLDYHEIKAPVGKRRTSAAGFAIAAERFGDRHISGVRGQEANYRALRMRKHGISTTRTCAPLGWWRTEEIFAYLALYDLPIHPAYAMTMGGAFERERLRVGAIGGERGTGHGRREWEQRYYGDELARLRS